jgi:hypothetical protein
MNNNIDLENALSGTGFASVSGYTFPQLVITGVSLILVASAIGSFFFLLWGGFEWITAGGEKEGLEKARKKITGALIGLVIVFCVYALSTIISILFLGSNESIFNLQIPSLTGSSSTSGGSSSACGGGLNLGQCGTVGGKKYRCVAYGQLCNTNPLYRYSQNCEDSSCP